jgi:hypothetical protein
MRRAVGLLVANDERESMWPLAYLSFTLLNQLSESSIFSSNSILWVLYVAAAFSVTGVASTVAIPAMPFAPESGAIAPDPDLTDIKDYA